MGILSPRVSPSGPFAWRRRRMRATLALAPLLILSACKTSDDAKAAATQMTATAQALQSYYAALHLQVVQTDQLNQLQDVVLGAQTYDAQTKALILDTAAELKKRADLAQSLADLAASLSALTNSTASSDAVTSAQNLASQLGAIKPFRPLSDAEQKGMSLAVSALVIAIQEHKERDAAQKMEQLADGLPKFFSGEKDEYNSLADQYIGISQSLAMWFLHNKQATSQIGGDLVKVALDPYDLTPNLTDPALQARLADLAPQQITAKAAQRKTDQRNATDAMESSLNQMRDRIHALASDKAIGPFTPASLVEVKDWAAAVLGK